jgi:TRAP-type uncharacterized transport system substrate-binding protein
VRTFGWPVIAGAVLAALAAWFVAVQRPFPPHTLVMATGPAGGAYADVGVRYREILGRYGIEVRSCRPRVRWRTSRACATPNRV